MVSFAQIFGVSLIAESIRITFFDTAKIKSEVQKSLLQSNGASPNPMAALTQVINAQAAANQPAKPRTKEQKSVDDCESKIKELNKEAEQYNNPEGFAKFGKINRQISKLERELKTLKLVAEEAHKNNTAEPLPEEETKQEVKEEQPKP